MSEQPLAIIAGSSSGLKRLTIKPYAGALYQTFTLEIAPTAPVKELRAAIVAKTNEQSSFSLRVAGLGMVTNATPLSDIAYDAILTVNKVTQRSNEQLAVLNLKHRRTMSSRVHGNSQIVRQVMTGLSTVT